MGLVWLRCGVRLHGFAAGLVLLVMVLICSFLVWSGLVWYGIVWYDMVWFVWYCHGFAVVLVLALVVVLIVGLVEQEHGLPSPSFPPSLHPSLLPFLLLLFSSFNIPKHSTRVEWLERWKGWPERAAPSPSGVLGNIDGRGKEGKEGGGMDVGRGGCVSSVPRE